MKKRFLMMTIALMLAASACSGGTGGSVSGTRQSCQSSGGSGTCEGSINRLSGTFNHRVETGFYRKGDAVQVDANFSIESGQMKASLEAPDGSLTTIEVAPGMTGTLSGIATVDSSMDEVFIPIRLEAMNGNVEGISFMISFSQP